MHGELVLIDSRRQWLLAATLSLAGVGACGDGFEGGAPTSSATSGPGAGGSGGASTSSSASVGGAGATGPCARGGCPGGMYCDDERDVCVSCADMSDFEIAKPEKLDALDQGVARRYARGTSDPAELLFTVVEATTNLALWVTPDMLGQAGDAMTGTQGGTRLSGPLETSVPLFGSKNFFYDSGTTLYSAVRNGASLSNVAPLPVVINVVLFNNASLAIAPGTERAWWMRVASSGNTAAELVTMSLVSGAAAPPKLVAIELDDGCARRGPDASPWAHPQGTHLFFSENEQNAACDLAVDDVHDLWLVEVDPSTGQATAPAKRIPPSMPGTDERQPSLSADMCWLYFTQGDGASSDLYRAPRK